jgi:hypothetical protein
MLNYGKEILQEGREILLEGCVDITTLNQNTVLIVVLTAFLSVVRHLTRDFMQQRDSGTWEGW